MLVSVKCLTGISSEISDGGRASFCGAAKAADMPTVDHWCSHKDIGEYIDSFEYNQWEYRHQRSGAWETPDGKEGLETPGLDLLVALVAKYNLDL